MKKSNILGLVVMFLGTSSFATDLVVQDGGPIGTYSSISSAVSASVDGDRILINNKLDGLPWTEDIIVNKSLSLLSAVDNQRFLVQGDYLIQHAPGREVNIVGMENANGHLYANANGNTSRTIVNLNWCKFYNSNIDFDYNYFTLNVASSVMGNGNTINLFHGNIIGNDFNDGKVYLTDDNITSSNDTINIVGNINVEHININTNDYYFFVANNLVGNYTTGITISNSKVGASINVIKNNTIEAVATNIFINSSNLGDLYIYNNLILDDPGADYGIRNYCTAANIVVSYNHIDSDFDYDELYGVVNDGTNVLSPSVNGVDGGSPGVLELDLDLTQNDAGVYGGSYTINNFHPIDGLSSKVYFLEMPRQIFVGGNNAVKGYSFDR